MEQRIGIIIVAGGGGSRMGSSRPKQFMLLEGLPILARTINNFAQALPGAPIIVVLPEAHAQFWRNLAARFDISPHTVVTGGEERFHSVRNGLDALPEEVELIAIQDGVRPLTSRELIRQVAAAAAEYGAAIPVIEPVDSFRQTDTNGSHIIDRHSLRIVQTPQIFRAELIRNAYQAEFCAAFTDDASVAELAGAAIHLCPGERSNLKITTPEDIVVAEALIQAAREQSDNENGEHL